MAASNHANVPPNWLLRQLWEEYKYRHELIWKTVFSLTYSIVAVSIVPYVSVNVAKVITWLILLLPFVAVTLGVFGVLRLEREITKSNDVRHRYLVLRDRTLNELTNSNYPDPDPDNTKFRLHMRMYVGGLILFAFLNVGPLLTVVQSADNGA
jgi:hypothetical protein